MARTKLETVSYWATIGMSVLAVWLWLRPPTTAVSQPAQPQKADQTVSTTEQPNPQPLYERLRWLITDPRFWTLLGLVAAAGLHVLAAVLKKQRPEEPYPVVAIYVHIAARGSESADKVRNLFEKAGWRVNVFVTEVPRHARGIWLHGGTDVERHIAEWGLNTLGIAPEIDYQNDNPPSLQVIVGAYEQPDHNKADLDRRSNEILIEQQKDQIEQFRTAFQETQADREAIRGQLGGTVQALTTCKRQFALARLSWFAERIAMNIALSRAEGREIADVHVTIRFAVYDDIELVKRIKKILEEYTKWPVEMDGSNKPTLMPRPDFKVIFESGLTGTFDSLSEIFEAGRLVDGTVGYRNANRADLSHLLIDVLPTVKAS